MPRVLVDPRRPANTTRFVYLQPEAARELFVEYDQIAIAFVINHPGATSAIIGPRSSFCSSVWRQPWSPGPWSSSSKRCDEPCSSAPEVARKGPVRTPLPHHAWLIEPADGSSGDRTIHGLVIVIGEGLPCSPRTTATSDAVLPSAGCSTLPGYAAHEMV